MDINTAREMHSRGAGLAYLTEQLGFDNADETRIALDLPVLDYDELRSLIAQRVPFREAQAATGCTSEEYAHCARTLFEAVRIASKRSGGVRRDWLRRWGGSGESRESKRSRPSRLGGPDRDWHSAKELVDASSPKSGASEDTVSDVTSGASEYTHDAYRHPQYTSADLESDWNAESIQSWEDVESTTHSSGFTGENEPTPVSSEEYADILEAEQSVQADWNEYVDSEVEAVEEVEEAEEVEGASEDAEVSDTPEPDALPDNAETLTEDDDPIPPHLRIKRGVGSHRAPANHPIPADWPNMDWPRPSADYAPHIEESTPSVSALVDWPRNADGSLIMDEDGKKPLLPNFATSYRRSSLFARLFKRA